MNVAIPNTWPSPGQTLKHIVGYLTDAGYASLGDPWVGIDLRAKSVNIGLTLEDHGVQYRLLTASLITEGMIEHYFEAKRNNTPTDFVLRMSQLGKWGELIIGSYHVELDITAYQTKHKDVVVPKNHSLALALVGEILTLDVLAAGNPDDRNNSITASLNRARELFKRKMVLVFQIEKVACLSRIKDLNIDELLGLVDLPGEYLFHGFISSDEDYILVSLPRQWVPSDETLLMGRETKGKFQPRTFVQVGGSYRTWGAS